jgi:hypothetical protein
MAAGATGDAMTVVLRRPLTFHQSWGKWRGMWLHAHFDTHKEMPIKLFISC